jgi:hypothetical protein
MPNPPDQPTAQANAPAVADQGTAPADEAATPPPPAPLPLNEDMARIFEDQVEIITQRQVYHTQLLFGVSGIGTDPVNARNATLTIARALRNNTPEIVKSSLANLGDAQLSQINDHTTPFNFNQQVAGLLEGILLDTISDKMRDDPARLQEARMLLENLFVEANQQMEENPHSPLPFRLGRPTAEPPKQLT